MKTRYMLVMTMLCGVCSWMAAQQKAPQEVFLLESFTQGKAFQKDRSVTTTTFNYDPVNRRMNYYDGSTRMVLEGVNMIDSVVVAGRTFIPYQRYFLEVVPAGDQALFIDWKVRLKAKGKEGVAGSRTQGNVQALDVSRMQNLGMSKPEVDLYEVTYENTYYLLRGEKLKKFTDAKAFLKLYPAADQQAIKDYIKSANVNFQQAEDALKLIEKF